MATIVILDLMGGVALLLWGLHMVQSGISRAFGSDLRWLLSHALGNRFAAFAAGLGLTALFQSSTATGLMAASFAAERTLPLVTALAIMLGANVGTTLIVLALSFNVAAAAPILFVLGLLAFRFGTQSRVRNTGRIAIGLGLMLLALHILLVSSAPAENAPIVRTLLQAITGDPVLCIVIAAAFTWAAHSSVATVLLIMSLAYSHFITPAAALALVLGANLGSAINPVFEGVHRGDPASYRLPVGNLDQPAGRHRPGGPVPADADRGACVDTARHGQADRPVPHRVQCRAGRHFHRPARSVGLAADQAVPDAAGVRQPVCAALSRRERARDALARTDGCSARNAADGRLRREHAPATSCWR